MGILRTDRVSGLGGANAIKGSVFFSGDGTSGTAKGTSLNITGSDKDDLNFAGNDFTFEAWVFPANNISWNLLYGQSWPLQIYIDTSSGDNFVKVYVGSNDTGTYAISGASSAAGTIKPDSWNHVAFSRSGNSWTIFTNGTAATSSTSSQSLISSNADYTIGIFNSIGSGNDAGSYFGFNGYISNLRIRTGAHYLPSTNFTPPVGELQKTSDTVLLACQSPGDITKEATGKTLVPTSKNLNDALPQASHFTPNSPVGFSTTTDVGTQFGTTFDGVTTFDSQAYMVPPGGNTRERNRGRGVFGGGVNGAPSAPANIAFIDIQSQGNTTKFGDLTTSARVWTSGFGSSTRGIWPGGAAYNGTSSTNIIDFVTIATTSNATDFGDLSAATTNVGARSSQIRGVIAGGYISPANLNTIDFVTVATTGNASDFGDITVARRGIASMGSSTRAVFAGGMGSPALVNVMDFVTIATTGNASDFGDMTQASRHDCGGCSSGTRGIIAGGKTSPANINTIQFITIASAGNASDFGDLTETMATPSSLSNSIRGVFTGSYGPDSNTINFVTIATTGNASDFGDNTFATSGAGATSDSHGGLS